MLRILSFLILVFALGLGFAWLAERPGTMLVTFNGYEYQVTLMVAAVIATATVAAVMISWWLVKSLWNSPYTVARYFRVRRRDRGYQALSTGLIAAGAGDADAARRKHRESAKLLSAGQEPLLQLLEAQTSLLDGDHAGARKKFEAMLDDPEMRLIGLRGLYLEAQRLGDRGVARHYAERANSVAPQLSWAANAALESKMTDGDWDGALRILDAQKATRQIEREAAAKNRAVLLTAKAISIANTDPLASKNAAIEANRLDPALVPAAVIAAKALFKQDDLRKGAKILEAAWKQEPHPEIADAYVHARPGDSPVDRLKRARKLDDLRQNNVESSIAVARAALDAGDYKAAREAAEAAARLQPREGVFLLMADIDEADGGDQGRVRQHLARAVKAQPDPAWSADGYVSEKWAPFSPVTGRIGAFEWRVPVERIGQLIEQTPQTVVAGEPARIAPAPVVVAKPPVAEVVEVASAPAQAPTPAPTPPHVPANDRFPTQASAAVVPPTVPPQPAALAEVLAPAASAPPRAADQTSVEPPIPDDPGVDSDDASETARRFRLF
jgi:HemY protein